MSDYHKSVLLNKTLEFLNIAPSKKYIDATLGGGGHTRGILERGGIVLGIDVDRDAIGYVSDSNLKLRLVRGNFRNIDTIALENGFDTVSGILFDLGVSSHQLDTKERGFSFLKDSQLDMRMDKTLRVGAKDLINGLNRAERVDLIYRFGEEHFAKRIADKIVEERAKKTIETTQELACVVERVYPKGGNAAGRHPATKLFQALRIIVNDELNSLEEALPKAVELLQEGGRLLVISFHSLEDRIVKNRFKEFENKGWGCVLTKKPVTPSNEESEANPRSRSAKLRVFEKSL